MIYVFDTNAVSDLLRAHPGMVAQVRAKQVDNIMCLCQPVDYEIQRGLSWRSAIGQQQRYQNQIKSQFEWLPLTDADWRQAAQFWVDASNTGKQLSDVDLLIAALVKRVNGVLITADHDFDALPIQRENWRKPE